MDNAFFSLLDLVYLVLSIKLPHRKETENVKPDLARLLKLLVWKFKYMEIMLWSRTRKNVRTTRAEVMKGLKHNQDVMPLMDPGRNSLPVYYKLVKAEEQHSVERVHSIFCFLVIVHHRRKSGKKFWSRSHGGSILNDLLLMTYLDCFLIQPRTTRLKRAPPTMGWACPPSILNQGNAQQFAYRPNYKGIF